MKAYIKKGKFKGKEAEVSQWCNDWFMLQDYNHQPVSPTMLAFTEKDMEYIKNHKNNGVLFNIYEIAPLVPQIKTRYGLYMYTFRKQKTPHNLYAPQKEMPVAKSLKQLISFSQAYMCIKTQGKKGTYVHTYRDLPFGLIGADWTTKSLVKAMKKYESTLQLTGEHARNAGHGIVFFDDAGAVFVETIEKELKLLEKSL